MTKKTVDFCLAVFEYCSKIALIAKHEGVLFLEETRYDERLAIDGKILFNKKIDKYLYWAIGLIVDGTFSASANCNLIASIGRMAGPRTLAALKVASVCMREIAYGGDFEKTIAVVGTYIGPEHYTKIWEVYRAACVWYQKDSEKKSLADEHKERVAQVNEFLKNKEEKCDLLLAQKYDELCKLHDKVPQMTKKHAWVGFEYKPQGAKYGKWLYANSIGDSDGINCKSTSKPCFIGDLPVCSSMERFWYSYEFCGRDIQRFMRMTDDIQNTFAKSLFVTSSIRLWRDENN